MGRKIGKVLMALLLLDACPGMDRDAALLLLNRRLNDLALSPVCCRYSERGPAGLRRLRRTPPARRPVTLFRNHLS